MPHLTYVELSLGLLGSLLDRKWALYFDGAPYWCPRARRLAEDYDLLIATQIEIVGGFQKLSRELKRKVVHVEHWIAALGAQDSPRIRPSNYDKGSHIFYTHYSHGYPFL